MSFRYKMASLLLSLSAISGVANADLFDNINANKSIRVGFAEQEPFIVTSANGGLSGYEVDLLDAVLARFGTKVDLQAVPTQFGALIPGLQANRFDVIASDLWIRADRAKLVAFANPTHAIIDGVIVLKGNPKKIHSYEDIAKNPDIKLGYISGGGPIADHALSSGVKKEQLVALPDFASLINSVKTKRIDAFVNPNISINAAIKTANDPAIERAEPFKQAVIDGKSTIAYGSYAFRTSDKAFVQQFNVHLKEVIASGEALKIGEKYGFTANDIPAADFTLEDALK
ncbi:Arginine ABC transporter [Klebsiella quasipneumoniae]|uniref:Ectoine/hydroxyectoine ABC transporter substrate-binding protein EhuB n=1 Tax=Klebsiella pneumoniae TaxID=573 RepID=A0A9J6S675_KLEPN|nr:MULTISPECIES: ectoine/hydroxyectoine ABC transporter substrate-binding protein EhuB [Klebsiella]MRL38821.1 ectoine/hydroxyectoine ABC transporter substrate-binding protein EhuB [Klebsiella pneumoniae]HCT5784542.1 ectoine/hydroxyectoine ABC transporter substrate-binding protein EhuB [Klebsiella variicola]MCE0161642.1 ectoine/hydroxyectoine ABC transporter substrate-binding protein EhuB [Klebsiella variicola subsp. variicola]VGG57391.1 Arginine ABC transporter [Klebsiella quasipneumoniae]HBX6